MKLFDMDGTLIDSTGVWREVDYKFLANHNLTVSGEYLANITRSTFPIAAQYTRDYYCLDLSPEAIIAEWTALVRDAYEHHIPLKPGAYEYLVRCVGDGDPIVLVTSCAPELSRAVLDRHGLTPMFKHLLFAQELGIEKRDPRFFDQVLDYLKVSPADCTLYEDSPENCAIAKGMGMRVIGVLDRLYVNEWEQLKQICDLCISDFTELLN